MKKPSIPQLSEQIAAPLTSIASPQRIAILLAIGNGDACVCHLEAALGWRQAYISQHLMALRKADILQGRREGRYVILPIEKRLLSGPDHCFRLPEWTLRRNCFCNHQYPNLPIL
jgi:DNA-binding transcriptional ArsR family regulator